jgi:hypothetical protein
VPSVPSVPSVVLSHALKKEPMAILIQESR